MTLQQLLTTLESGRLVAVEEAEPDLVAVRPLTSAKVATRFVKARLDAYDRLWDG